MTEPMESDLRRVLDGAVSGLAPSPDASDVRRRLARSRRRRLGTTVAAAASVGALIVVLAAWPGGHDRQRVAVSDGRPARSAPITTFDRTTSDGVALHVTVVPEPEPAPYSDGYQPPDECFPDRSIAVTASRDGQTVPATAGTPEGPAESIEVGTNGFRSPDTTASPDGKILRIIIVMVHSELPLVRAAANFVDGHVDSMDLIDHYAVLASGLHTVPDTIGDPELTLTSVDLTFADGATLSLPSGSMGVNGVFGRDGVALAALGQAVRDSGACNGPTTTR